MKKITIITALISVVAFVLSGCSKDGGTEDDRLYPMANNYVWNYVRPAKIFLPDDLSPYNKGNGAYRQYVFSFHWEMNYIMTEKYGRGK